MTNRFRVLTLIAMVAFLAGSCSTAHPRSPSTSRATDDAKTSDTAKPITLPEQLSTFADTDDATSWMAAAKALRDAGFRVCRGFQDAGPGALNSTNEATLELARGDGCPADAIEFPTVVVRTFATHAIQRDALRAADQGDVIAVWALGQTHSVSTHGPFSADDITKTRRALSALTGFAPAYESGGVQ